MVFASFTWPIMKPLDPLYQGEIMDNIETPEMTEINFGKELVKSFAVSTAQSAGVYVALGLVLVATGKIMDVFNSRKDKKNRIETN